MGAGDDAAPDAEARAPEVTLPPKQVDKWLKALTEMRDLEPEDPTDEELRKIQELRAAVLEAEGLKEPPSGVWQANFYLRSTLLKFLRGRDGDVAKAATMLTDAQKWFEEHKYWERLRKFEEEGDPAQRLLLLQYAPEGPLGVDKRGAPVVYCKMGLKDVAGMVRETSMDMTLEHHLYMMERDRHTLNEFSAAAGKSFMGVVLVLDYAGMTWARAKATVQFTVWISNEILKDRFPEAICCIYCVNVPWFFKMGWSMVAPFLPEATKRKMRIYRNGFLPALQERVDLDQIPAFLGGESKAPWPYGDGGDLPNTKGEDAAGADAPVALEVSKLETVTVEVPAGKACIWEWTVEKWDIDVTRHENGKEVQPQQRLASTDGWQSGKLVAGKDAPAMLKLTFDNSFSWARRKRILYKTFIMDDAEAAVDEGDAQNAL